MKVVSFLRFLYFTLFLFTCSNTFSQTPDFKVQHLEIDVPGSGTTLTAPSNFIAVANLNNAFIIVSNNRRNGAGPPGSGSNIEARGMSCTANFNSTTSISLSRGTGATITTRVNLMIVEYIGPAGGPNEFIVRHRGAVTPTAGTTVQTLTMNSTPTNINKCIPFYSVKTTDTANGAAADTFMAFCSGSNTLNYHRGGAVNTVTVRVEVVEFTGSNWSVGHGDSGITGNDLGTITLNTSATGSGGSVFDVGSFNNAFIWHTYKGDSNSGSNEALADNYPVYTPSGTTQVDWQFHANHDGVSERHFVHVLKNPEMTVTHFSDDVSNADETTINITSAGLTDIEQALILGSSTTSGTGTAYGRGWRNYYLKSTTEAAHWSHRSGNTLRHEIQIINLTGLNTQATDPGQLIDSDFDGIPDGVDADDDNDGILDSEECDTIVNPPLQNPDFEAINILTLDGGPTDVVPTSGIWKGDANNIPNWKSSDPTNNHLEIWHNTQAAGNDAGGQAYSGVHWAEINATTNDGLYQDVVSTPGDVLQWSFAHRKRTGYAGSAVEDQMRLLIGNSGGTLTSQGTFVSAANSSWTVHSGTYIVPAGQTSTRLTFTVVSTASGSTSSGNFIDNVQLFVIPKDCIDTDRDGIPDYLDLDSDNDGIPDIVEAGFANQSQGTGTVPLTGFTDANHNGLHDPFENILPLDSDSDGVPNFRDLDSDNDTVFDVDEARTERTDAGLLTFENGDGDFNGDGVGDGPESELFRTKIKNDDSTELYGDGILDVYDFSSEADQYGNLTQGQAPHYANDADNDGIPDYIDKKSDGISFDISKTIYAHLDTNNDGVIDGTGDSDGDGILNLFDTNDAVFGSPRDLDTKLSLYFDGRNDYVEDVSVINGWGEASIMSWIKIDPLGTGEKIILGQDKFHLILKSNLKLEVNAKGTILSSPSALATNRWIHVAATYSASGSRLKLFINGSLTASVSISGSLPADATPLTIGKQSNVRAKYFHGEIDEVRVFDKSLSDNELQKIIYQEIQNNSGKVRGTEIPRDITNFINATNIVPLNWSALKRYYRFDTYKDDIADNLTTPAIDLSGAKIYNSKIIIKQTAPMPFVTQQSGNLPNAVGIPAYGVNGNDVLTYDWSIVKIKHNNVNHNSYQKHLGLIVNATDSGANPIEFSVQNDSELNVSWYLKLDGFIDLDGESQLIQGLDSELDITSSGKIEKDQQGTADTYTYNYWASPVSKINTSINNLSSPLPLLLKDGSNPLVPKNITFLTSGNNGSAGSPIGLADYWIWKFANQTDDDYSAWQHVRSNGIIKPGEGYTMKGPGTGPIANQQNYVFLGKPNNGDINLPLNAGNDYLVGNPYASALDANQFILDNGPIIAGSGANPLISGTLYFWEHWGGGSHNLADYQGGYATYNLAGGVAAPSYGTNDPDVATGGVPTKLPGRYIPVGQGFFVVGENSGTIKFNNGQRIFEKEGSNSMFVRNATPSNTDSQNNDTRMKFRIGFNSVNSIHRQLLLTVDENATMDVDWGYDARTYDDSLMDDMYWRLNNQNYNIQAIDDITESTVVPIGLHTNSNGISTISIDKLENVPDDIEILLHDKDTDTYHNLRTSDYQCVLNAGSYLNKYELVFNDMVEALSTAEEALDQFKFYYSTTRNRIVIMNPNQVKINKFEIYNILGQSALSVEEVFSERYSEYPIRKMSTGTYIIKMQTEKGIISKKVIIK